MTSRNLAKAFDAVSAMPDLSQIKPSGVVYSHEDYPGEHFLPARNPVTGNLWDGAYQKELGGFYWQVWISSVERHAEIPFPTSAEKLKPISIN